MNGISCTAPIQYHDINTFIPIVELSFAEVKDTNERTAFSPGIEQAADDYHRRYVHIMMYHI